MGLSHTVSGDIASFRTPSRVPIESLKIHFLPKQEGSGDPSSQNVRPITGWTGCNLLGSKRNFINFDNRTLGYPSSTSEPTTTKRKFDITTYVAGLATSNYWNRERVSKVSLLNGVLTFTPVTVQTYGIGFPMLLKPGTYKFDATHNCRIIAACYYKEDGTYISSESIHSTKSFTVPSTAYYTVIDFLGYTDTATTVTNVIVSKKTMTYEDYEGNIIPITFPSNGKNLYDISTYPLSQGYVLWPGNGTADSGYPNYATTLGFIPCENIAGRTVTLNRRPGGGNPGFAFYKEANVLSRFAGVYNTNGTAGTPWTIEVPKEAKYMRFSVPANTYDIQIELGDTSTAYEPYSSNNTFYGGYYDPVAGEIVAEWKSIDLGAKTYSLRSQNENRQVWECYCSDLKTTVNGNARSCNAYCSEFSKTTSNGLWSVGKFAPTTSNNNIVIIFAHPASSFANGSECKEAMNGIQFVYELKTPIHIPVTPQDLKAFLDHNNFWSDANDITEVTYAVTESKDMLTTRKLAMDFDMGHRKKVRWNQIQVDGNFQDKDKWAENSYGSISNEDGIMTWTCHTQPTQFYHTGFYIKESAGFVAIPYNHKIVIAADIRCSVSTRVRLYGLVSTYGNTYIYSYYNNNVNIPANEWTHLIGFIMDRPETPPSSATDTIIKRFKPTIQGTSGDISTITVGTTLEVKNFMAFDLTQMFGLGNEPSTVAEFEHICELNGIDLTTYQPYDTGSDRWLILP